MIKQFLINNGFILYGRCNCSGGYTEKWRNVRKTIHVQFTHDRGKILEVGDVTNHEELKIAILKLISDNEIFDKVLAKTKR